MDDTGFLLLLAVATKQASKVPVNVSSAPLPKKSTTESASSLPPVPVAKKKKDSKKKQSTVSTGSFFLDDSEEGQTVYRRASVYFSIVKSSRKFPGYFNPVEKRIIVNCKLSNLPVLPCTSPFPFYKFLQIKITSCASFFLWFHVFVCLLYTAAKKLCSHWQGVIFLIWFWKISTSKFFNLLGFF